MFNSETVFKMSTAGLEARRQTTSLTNGCCNGGGAIQLVHSVFVYSVFKSSTPAMHEILLVLGCSSAMSWQDNVSFTFICQRRYSTKAPSTSLLIQCLITTRVPKTDCGTTDSGYRLVHWQKLNLEIRNNYIIIGSTVLIVSVLQY